MSEVAESARPPSLIKEKAPAEPLGITPKPELHPLLASKEVRQSKEVSGDLAFINYEFYEFRLPSGEPIKIIFKSPDEIIDPKVIKEKHTIIIGNPPQHLPEAVWQEWQEKMNGRNFPTHLEHSLNPKRLSDFSKDGGLTLIVNQDPQSLTETALLLGATDPQIRDFYRQARKFQYSNELITLIDEALATRIYYPDGTKKEYTISHDAEALLLASMLDDRSAKQVLKKLAELYQQDLDQFAQEEKADLEQFFNKPIWTQREKYIKPIELEELVAVHVTNYYPYFDEKSSSWKIKTLFDNSQGKFPRTSIHFTLNDVVSDNAGGTWSEKPIAIIAPLAELIKANGLPYSLNGVDTSWNLNPGQDLILPESTTILAPGPTGGELSAPAKHNELSHRNPKDGIRKINYQPTTLEEFSRLQEAKREFQSFQNIPGSYGSSENIKKFHQLEKQEQELKRAIADTNRNAAVRKLIGEMGFEIIQGGSENWGNSPWEHQPQDDTRLAYLARNLNVSSALDRGTKRLRVEDGAMKGQYELGRTRVGATEAHLFLARKPSDILEIPPQQRRMLWAMGLI